MKARKSLATLCAAVLLWANPVIAEDVGEAEFLDTCASCHGAGGLGDGPIAELMAVEVPALTGLAAANDGVFPMLDVIQTIDGRQNTRGHGFPMPVWGDRFAADAIGEGIGPFAAETVVRGRILSLAYFLETIQE